jgi:septal ring factor EnvC (AmiA/AmiB activator)
MWYNNILQFFWRNREIIYIGVIAFLFATLLYTSARESGTLQDKIRESKQLVSTEQSINKQLRESNERQATAIAGLEKQLGEIKTRTNNITTTIGTSIEYVGQLEVGELTTIRTIEELRRNNQEIIRELNLN